MHSLGNRIVHIQLISLPISLDTVVKDQCLLHGQLCYTCNTCMLSLGVLHVWRIYML